MVSSYLPQINIKEIKQAYDAGEQDAVYDALVQPLHEELYRRQTFSFVDSLSWGQQLLLTYDYLQMQANQGGFIQFINNGYIGLLPAMVEQLYKLGANEMAQVLDDVLKVYVLNRDLLESAKSVEAFAKLYEELKEFEIIDERYSKLNKPTTKLLLDYALKHIAEFGTDADASS